MPDELTPQELALVKEKLEEHKKTDGIVTSGRYIERVKVVRWLRAQARERSFASASECLVTIADEIERGDHIAPCPTCGRAP